jgi:hypothetical protein
MVAASRESAANISTEGHKGNEVLMFGPGGLARRPMPAFPPFASVHENYNLRRSHEAEPRLGKPPQSLSMSLAKSNLGRPIWGIVNSCGLGLLPGCGWMARNGPRMRF